MRPDQIILYPVVTEKTTSEEARGKYIFRVLTSANKTEIKKAIEKIFNTKVTSVRIINTKPKKRRRGRIIGKISGFKKAIVTLEKGKRIKIREEKKGKEVKNKTVKKTTKEEKKEGVKTRIKENK